MCGIIGIVAQSAVNQLLYDGLLVLQHRGQDAAGIVTAEGPRFHLHKGAGLVLDVFRTRNMRSLTGNMGIGHVRYPTRVRRRRFPRRSRSMSTRHSASFWRITVI
jgi:amidophosphoribosyltransferase